MKMFNKKGKKVLRIQVQRGHKRFWVKGPKKIKRWEAIARKSQGRVRIHLRVNEVKI